MEYTKTNDWEKAFYSVIPRRKLLIEGEADEFVYINNNNNNNNNNENNNNNNDANNNNNETKESTETPLVNDNLNN